jgi:hypothetical protein
LEELDRLVGAAVDEVVFQNRRSSAWSNARRFCSCMRAPYADGIRASFASA